MRRSAPRDDPSVEIERDGFTVLRDVFGRTAVGEILVALEASLRGQTDRAVSIRGAGELIYAARNLLSIWPACVNLAAEPAIRRVVASALGSDFGLVRALFFDKPPGRSWSLPWHKDMTIAVRENAKPSQHFSKPTVKAGVPHVEAPDCVLSQMLTARIHLDDVTDENGPLVVVAGSHRTGKNLEPVAGGDARLRTIFATAGDVLLMRPLVAHASGNSREDTARHRRIVHLEFASATPLPDGYDWHDFRPIAREGTSYGNTE